MTRPPMRSDVEALQALGDAARAAVAAIAPMMASLARTRREMAGAVGITDKWPRHRELPAPDVVRWWLARHVPGDPAVFDARHVDAEWLLTDRAAEWWRQNRRHSDRWDDRYRHAPSPAEQLARRRAGRDDGRR